MLVRICQLLWFQILTPYKVVDERRASVYAEAR